MTLRRLVPVLAATFAVAATLAVAAALAGCGASGHDGVRATDAASSATATSGGTTVSRSHPHAVQPVAGDSGAGNAGRGARGAHGGGDGGRGAGGASGGGAGGTITGDPTAHAPSLRTVRRELVRLNLCGGTTSAADATPIVASSHPGFVADPGTVQTVGRLPLITADLTALGRALGVTIYGISGYRTPAHSVAVGGYADDPHTKGQAEDIGVDSLLRSSAAQISEAELARFGLYRPFDPSDDPANTEVNHVQLIPHGGPLSLAAATATFDPDPSCS